MFGHGYAPVERLKAGLQELQDLTADSKGIVSLEYAILAMVMVSALVAGFPLLAGGVQALLDMVVADLTFG